MIITYNPKFNPKIKQNKKETKPIEELNSKLRYFINAKLPIINRWNENSLHLKKLDSKAFEWAFNMITSPEMVEVQKENGEMEKINKYKTKEDMYGKYTYNAKGIPSKIKDYIDDIVAREQVANIQSMVLSPNDKNLLTKILQEGFINDTEWKTTIKKQIIEDILCKGDFFVSVDSYNLTRNVRRWDKLDKEGDYIWGKAEEMPDKIGTFVQYIDPEFIFPEPDTDNPQEFFIAKPYTYSEFIREFPELESNVIKKSYEIGKISNTTNQSMGKETIYADEPFPYRVVDRMIDLYENKHKIGNNGNAQLNNWFHDPLRGNCRGTHYERLEDTRRIWVWTYYNLNYDPNNNKIGDHCIKFVNNWQLYSGAIPNADKEVPFVKCGFEKVKGSYWSRSMVDELRPLQEKINDIENVKQANLDMLMTTNLAINSKLISPHISLDRMEINVIPMHTEDEEPGIIETFNVAQTIQPLALGNANGLEAADRSINEVLMQMDAMFPKPISNVQLQPEQNVKDSNFSPVLRLNTIINQINSALSNIGVKFIKETVGTIRYFNIKGGKALTLPINVLPIKVVKDQEEREIEKAKEALISFNNYLSSQQDTNQPPQEMINPASIETLEMAGQVMQLIQSSGFPIESNTTYMLYDNLVRFGSSGLELKVSLSQSRMEVIKDTQEFISVVNAIGGVTINPALLVKELAVLYNQNLDILATDPPDAVVQAILQKGNFRVVSQDYLGEGAAAMIRKKILGIDPVPFNPENEKYQEYVNKTTANMALADQSAENKIKLETAAQMLVQNFVNSQDAVEGRSMEVPELTAPNPNVKINSNKQTVDVAPTTSMPTTSEQRPSAGMTS